MFQEEVEAKGIMAVPTVFKNGEEFHNGRASLEELLEKLLVQRVRKLFLIKTLMMF